MANEYDPVAEALPAYDVGDELGRGAWGVVLAGTHRRLRRAVAIKQLPREIGADPEVSARFLAEARTLASFDHPHIVHIHDFVEHKGLCLLIMDQLTGGTVGTRFRRGGFTPQAACGLILATCAGLQYAHERHVLHRDIKPENLMFSGDGVLKVVDFGIAKLVGSSSIMATRAGSTLGTPAYIAPEQARSSTLTPATDVYSTATLLYELLAGELPYPEVSDPVAAIYQHIHEDPRPLLQVAPSIPPEVARVVDGALSRDPAGRPQSAEEFGQAVARAATDAWGLGWSSVTGIPLRGDVAMLLPSGERRQIETATPEPETTPSEPTVVSAPGATVVDESTLLPRELAEPLVPAPTTSADVVPDASSKPELPGYLGPKPETVGNGKTRRPIAIAAGGGVVLIAAVVAVIVMVGNTGGGSGASADPQTVAKAMLDAYNSGNDQAASSYFAAPLDVLGNHEYTQAQVKELFATSLCGGTLQSISAQGETVTVTLKLFPRPGHLDLCPAPYNGTTSNETIIVHNGKVVSWQFS